MKLIVRIVLGILSFFVTCLLIVTIIFLFQKENGNTMTISGYTSFVNIGTSMLPEIQVGDMVIVHEEESYKIGDIISYENDDEITVTHRIIDKDGKKYITKGDNNKFTDGEKVARKDIYGKVVFTIPKVGHFITYVNNNKENLLYILGGLVVLGMILKYGAKHAG